MKFKEGDKVRYVNTPKTFIGIFKLGKAVPPDSWVATLIKQVDNTYAHRWKSGESALLLNKNMHLFISLSDETKGIFKEILNDI